MIIYHHRQQHGEHLASEGDSASTSMSVMVKLQHDCDLHKGQRAKMLERLEDEQLPE